LLRLENVVQRHLERTSGRSFEALRVHELNVAAGEILSIVGPNGSGKSTLLEVMSFLNRPDEGRILLDGTDMWEAGTSLTARRQIPLLLQRTVLFSGSVLKNVMFGLHARGLPAAEARRRSLDALELTGLQHLAQRRQNELSGGEKRRVALARVLALDSQAIVLDEPTAGLDRESEAVMEELIKTVNRERGTTIVMASHNYRQAIALSTRRVTLIQGKLIPHPVDNLFAGVLRQKQGVFEFAAKRDWTFAFASEHVTVDSWLGADVRRGPCLVSLSAEGFTVLAGTPTDQPVGEGVVEGIRQDEDACRLRIRLDSGPLLHITISLDQYRRPGIALGTRLTLGLKPGAIRLLPPPPAT